MLSNEWISPNWTFLERWISTQSFKNGLYRFRYHGCASYAIIISTGVCKLGSKRFNDAFWSNYGVYLWFIHNFQRNQTLNDLASHFAAKTLCTCTFGASTESFGSMSNERPQNEKQDRLKLGYVGRTHTRQLNQITFN